MAETKPAIAVVDPISTGAALARFLADQKYSVVRVFSDMCPDNIRALVKEGCEVDWAATVEHQTGSLEDTAMRLKDLGCAEVLVGAETGVNLCDELTTALGVRGNGTKQLKERRNKFFQAEVVRDAGLDAPRQVLASEAAHVEQFLSSFEGGDGIVPFKAVVKPVEGAGSDGVTICNAADEVRTAYKSLEGTKNLLGLANYEVLLQEFLHGTEYVVDTVSREGEHKVVAIWRYDKRDYHGSPVVYHGMRLLNVEDNPKLHTAMVDYVRAVLDALGIRNGAMHSEVMATPRGPVLVEVNCRLHGGEGIWLPIAQQCLGYTQVSAMHDAYFAPAAFASLPPTPRHPMANHGAWVTIRSPTTGIVKEVKQGPLEQIRKLPSYFDEYIAPFVTVGNEIVQTVDATTVHGCFNLVHADLDQLQADYDAAQQLINESLFTFETDAGIPLFRNPSPLLDESPLRGRARKLSRDAFSSPSHVSPAASCQSSPTLRFASSPLMGAASGIASISSLLLNDNSIVLEPVPGASAAPKMSFSVNIS